MNDTMETTIPCLDECCGCLNAKYDEAKNIWIFSCNECSKEWGRGSLGDNDLLQIIRDLISCWNEDEVYPDSKSFEVLEKAKKVTEQ